MENQKIIYRKDNKLFFNINVFKEFYIPILFILFFIQQSVYGSKIFNGLGISGLLAIFFIIVFIKNINKIPKTVIFCYSILIAYTFFIVYSKGEDWNNWIISILSLASVGLFININITESQLKKGLIYTGILANIILIIYNFGNYLKGWNSNTVGLLTTIGTLGTVVSYKMQTNKKSKILNMMLVLFSIYMVFLTGNRNSLLVILISFITIILIKAKSWKKYIVLTYLVIALSLPILVVKTTNQVNNIAILNYITSKTEGFFNKDTIFSGREEIWKIGEELTKNSRWIGNGESLYNYLYVHNMYYSVVYFFGIIGYLVYCTYIYNVVKVGLKDASELQIHCILLFIAILFEQIAENTLFTAKLNTFMPYLFLSIAINKRLKEVKGK